ncbi:MAG: ATP-binding protein [Paludibacteraceae bacterium]|nr:ATP-binding protein [Paludibacteraceae bacterium]
MEKLQNRFNIMLSETPVNFHRYMYERIDWSDRLIGLKGPRGVGKTTLLLQRAKEVLDRDTTLLVNADDLYFTTHTLVDLADEFVRTGGKVLMIDEIHKYKEWSRELKLIYDYHKDLKVVFTGSSILDIEEGEADLSRRVVPYEMQGLSFREYLRMFKEIELPKLTLDEILSNKLEMPAGFHPYAYFNEYLRIGYYPFSNESQFERRLAQVVNKTIEVDIPQYTDMTISAIRKLKRLMSIVSESVPFKPNYTSLSQVLGVSRNLLPEWFAYMEKAGLIMQLRDDTGGIRGLGKVDKVYIDNTALMYMFGQDNTEIGNVRETFFMNQTRVMHDVITSSVSDFQIGKYTFEVGGKNKTQKQIAGVSDAFVVKDDIEIGYQNVIPLWMFGLMY